MQRSDDLAYDILWGAKEIARFLGCSEKSVWNMHHRGQLPTFTHGRRVCARRSTLISDIEQRERARH
ncbi:hypothetical protein GGQ97_002648 [Sphingomonas kaistensis]|uniref:Helix-turn-helix domain-containing protein n=1 Tax=Sphingomonas kaistensis TaxID=298708 RepID=A0A7X5Y8L8_9SPHN|nr:hypothetical protein [Sphingomonas kaistensis]